MALTFPLPYKHRALEDRYMLSETPQTAEMRAMLDQPPGALTYNPFVGMSDQEIRARALECAVKIFFQPAEEAIERARKFEDYIRDGNDGS